MKAAVFEGDPVLVGIETMWEGNNLLKVTPKWHLGQEFQCACVHKRTSSHGHTVPLDLLAPLNRRVKSVPEESKGNGAEQTGAG